jgi:hypothetical protein
MSTLPTSPAVRHPHVSLLPGRAWGFGALAVAVAAGRVVPQARRRLGQCADVT